jgi:predicted RNA-binding Zn-ribbon protein involved in translation (DUF1610 family)
MEDTMEWYLSTLSGQRLPENPDEPLGAAGLTHDCPFCGQQASQGRALTWIAMECAEHGAASYPCNNCGRFITAPGSLFLGDRLEELKARNYDARLRQLNQRGFSLSVQKMKARELLFPNWGEVIQAVNQGLPVRIEPPAWDGQGTCPGCGQAGPVERLAAFKCVDCDSAVTVPQANISRTEGAKVACVECGREMTIPPEVWCQVCGRNLRAGVVIQRLVEAADAGW